MPFNDEIKEYTGLTDEITGGQVCLNDCFIGELEEIEPDVYLIGLSISGAKYYPRRVATREPNENDVLFWTELVGEENIIKQ